MINILKVHNRFMDESDRKRGHFREKIDWWCGEAGSVSLPMPAGEVVERAVTVSCMRVNIKKGYFQLFGQRKNRMAMWEVQKEVAFFTLPKKFYK